MPGARPYLRFSLRTFLVVTLVLSVTLGIFGRIWLKAYRDSQPPTLHELAQIAKRHGIPMPPPGAKLVLAKTGERHGEIATYSPAFLLEARADGSALVLRGAEEELLTVENYVIDYAGDPPDAPLLREFSLDTKPHPQRWKAEFHLLSALVCAAQLADRNDAVAENVLQRLVKEEYSQDSLHEAISDLEDLRLLMARCIYDYWEHRMLKHSDEWPAIRENLNRLFAEFPRLGIDHVERAEVRRDLAAAVEAPAAAEGSTEALLLQWSRQSDVRWNYWTVSNNYGGAELSDEDELPRSILLRGFDAVPELIALRDDSRITAHFLPEWGHRPDRILRVGDLANNLLWEISGFRWREPLTVPVAEDNADVDVTAWHSWWKEAQHRGEGTYCTENFFYVSDDALPAVRVRESLAQILIHKHPGEWSSVYDEYSRILVRHKNPRSLANAVAGTRLPTALTGETLAEFARLGSLHDKLVVLHVLAKLDSTRAAELLLPLMDELPADEQAPYAYSRAADCTDDVLLMDDQRVWRNYLAAIRRSSVGQRMEMLRKFDYWPGIEGIRPLRLAMLQAFLDDDSVRDATVDSVKFGGDCAAADFPVIAVRDFVAMNLARMLALDITPDPRWPPEQWSALRDQVRQRLAQEKLPELE
jgi:hypothetical protein